MTIPNLFILISSLIFTSNAQNIVVRNHESTQDYYLRFTLENADASSCGDSISGVYILENGDWRVNFQQHDETNGYGVAFSYNSAKFSDLLPISVKIAMSSGREIYLMEIITTISDASASFTSSESICADSSPVSSPSNTPSPSTPAPVQDNQGDDNQGNQDNDNQGSSGDGISGHATHYGGSIPGVACGYKQIATAEFPYGYYAAVGSDTFDDGYQCGACYRVTCTGSHALDSGNGCGCTDRQSVIVQIMDRCPECSNTHFDLDIDANDAISTCDMTNIEFERVDCEYTTNIKITAKEGSSVWWYGLYVYDVAGRGALSSIQLRPSGGGDWIYQCYKENAAFWLCSKSTDTYTLPMDIKFVDDEGNEVIAYGKIEHTSDSIEIDTGVQFEWSSSFEASSDQSTKSNDTGTLEIIAGIIGAVVLIFVILGVFGYIGYRKRSQKEVTFDHEDVIEVEMDAKQENEEQEQEAVTLNTTS